MLRNPIHACHYDADCINTRGFYDCKCRDGFSGNGIDYCDDVNECQGRDHGCSPFALCEDEFGTFTCTCGYGYEGNGTYCNDIDECEERTHSCPYDSNCKVILIEVKF